MNIRTDLAVEIHEQINETSKSIDGVCFSEESVDGRTLTVVRIEKGKGEQATGKKAGCYFTLDIGRPWNDEISEFKSKTFALTKVLKRVFGEKQESGSLLVAGLGNRTITADAIGPYAVNKLIVTRHIKDNDENLFKGLGLYDIAALSPGVLGQTGIESADIIKSVCNNIKPTALIAIDALAGRKLSRLATTIQISDCGIAPGSGVGNHRNEISEETMGIPVISIGVPTIVDAATLAYDAASSALGENEVSFEKIERLLNGNDLNFFVTPKETDRIMDNLASMIAYAINLTFNEDLSFEDMLALTE